MNAAVLLVDKPAGPTSFGCVARVRGALGGKRVKVGHAGTLDPFATGLLALLVGRATRLAPFLVGLDKHYRAVVQFGVRSDTGDPEGVLDPGDGPLPDPAALAAACAGLVGAIEQVPPATSAIKVGGQRAYALARAGKAVEMAPREVLIHALDVVSYDAPSGRAEIDIRCSKGTYVRALARDLGEALGPGAYCAELRRLAIGHLDVAGAGSLDEVARDPLAGRWRVRCSDALAHLPARELDAGERAALLHGRAIERRGEDAPLRALADGRLVCIAGPRGEELRPLVVVDEE
ncbi:MAG TPA: tRNA pseudouridine(55) synthase TruB [Gaiellales bacterium]|jgi:tRNA pseudouridine55 synthase|nr:tRNA pseudouridine(55) synthase TruB [Gaiellales bacterium]